jgi:hypothetical protein
MRYDVHGSRQKQWMTELGVPILTGMVRLDTETERPEGAGLSIWQDRVG